MKILTSALMKSCFQTSSCQWARDSKIKQCRVSTVTSVLDVTECPIKSSQITVQLSE